jgi:adenylate cyclase
LKKKKANRLSFSIWLFAGLLLALVVGIRYLDPAIVTQARYAVYDTYQQIQPRQYEPAAVRVIDIDEQSLSEFGQWPWPRTTIAKLVNRLRELGAASIAFDIIFTEPDRLSPKQLAIALDLPEAELNTLISKLPDGDKLLANIMSIAPVVLGVGATNEPVARSPKPKTGFANAGANPADIVEQYLGGIGNIAVLEEKASGYGSIVVGDNVDSVVRKISLMQKIGDHLFPSLSLESLRVAQGASTIITRASDASGEIQLGRVQTLQSLKVGAIEVPLTRTGEMWIHYTENQPERTLSVKDVMTSTDIQRLANLVQGHLVLVGTSAIGLKDIRATPLSKFEPGVMIHAQALEQMILQKFLERPDWADGVEILWLLALTLILIITLSTLGAKWSAITGLAAIGGSLWISWIAFSEYRLLLDPVYPIVAAILIFIAITILGFAQSEKNRAHIKKAFSSYLSPALVDQLADDPSALKLEGENKEMTFLFTDIASFTNMTEKTEPKLLVKTLNEYLGHACQIVMDNGGTIDKMIGDAIVAIYNAPVDQPDHAQRAVKTALELDIFCNEFSKQKQAEGIALLETRIGVNTGEAVVGNFGGAERFDYTVIGDAVNTAARMESVNKQLGTRICISETTVKYCDGLHFKPIANLVLKGKEQGVEAYVPVSEQEAQGELYKDYLTLYEKLQRDEIANSDAFEELKTRYPDDPLVNLHLNRLNKGERGSRMVFSEK